MFSLILSNTVVIFYYLIHSIFKILKSPYDKFGLGFYINRLDIKIHLTNIKKLAFCAQINYTHKKLAF